MSQWLRVDLEGYMRIKMKYLCENSENRTVDSSGAELGHDGSHTYHGRWHVLRKRKSSESL